MCHDDCEKHFPDLRRYSGILFVANSRQNAETILFVLTFGPVGFTGFRSLFVDRTFKMKRSTKYKAQGKAKQKRERPQPLRTGKIQSRTDLDPLNNNGI